uniref:MATE1 n=1 Tax=Arundo donax TaxID=35708 RepID=A0A0A9EG39_ARUDO
MGSRLFTDDQGVLDHIYIGIPFVCLTQPINTLAFVFDGINYGASDFGYAAYSMVLVAIVSIICILTLASCIGFIGVWIALTIYMSLRMFAGFWRIGTAQGPWAFLRT